MNSTRRLLRFASFNYRPFQWFDHAGRGVHMYGYNGEILRALVQSMSFDYEILQAHSWGLPTENGSWTGGLGMLTRDEANMTFYPTNPTADKMKIAHHTPTVNPIALVALHGRMSKLAKNPFGLIMTFDYEVWLYTLFLLVVVTMFMASAHRILMPILNERPKPLRRLIGKYLFMLFSHIWTEGEAHPPPAVASLRLMWITWLLLVSSNLMVAFAGQMMASMMLRPETPRIDTFKQLAGLDRIKVYLPIDSATYFTFKGSTEPHIKKLFSRVMAEKTVVTPSVMFSRSVYQEVLLNRACAIASSQALSQRALEMCKGLRRGEFYFSQEATNRFHAVFHMNLRLDPNIARNITSRILWMRDSGLLARWWKASAADWDGCVGFETEGAHGAYEPLTTTEIEGTLYLWLISLVVALIFLGGELVLSKAWMKGMKLDNDGEASPGKKGK